MPSFLDDENEMIIGATLSDIADQLLDNWMNSNLDEGEFYSDKQIAIMSDDQYIKDKFNKFYSLTETDEDYVC